ncbi:hypothetical protein [Acinetobacter stercoris]|uniref:Uncharacterized protein n=1 Tax=Acinetobacter stercoris TaxID=2126983 RepID=A0A2U3MUK4_9GAMM|nr:hypothetical protein [Acinetobacter stercoris]SPL69120.1 hypothetical protein KPC_0298 [Acinetobacter stercoris]
MDLESESCTDFKNGMIKIVDIMDHILSHPQAPIPANSWLPKKVKLLTTQDRILYLDGFGKQLIPYPEFDAQLEKNDEQASKSKKLGDDYF